MKNKDCCSKGVTQALEIFRKIDLKRIAENNRPVNKKSSEEKGLAKKSAHIKKSSRNKALLPILSKNKQKYARHV